jgi:hypothetical protein
VPGRVRQQPLRLSARAFAVAFEWAWAGRGPVIREAVLWLVLMPLGVLTASQWQDIIRYDTRKFGSARRGGPAPR